MIRSRTGRCVVFDLDDTLYDELDFVRSGFAAVCAVVQERYGFDCRSILADRFARRDLTGAYQAIAEAGGLAPESVTHMVEAYRSHRPVITPHDGVVDALIELKRIDGVVACITDGRATTQRRKIEALGLAELLDPVLISEETGHAKPDPHNFEVLMAMVQATRFWYVADNPAKDFIAPKRLGWITIGIRNARGVHVAARHHASEYLPDVTLPLRDALARACQSDTGVPI